MDAEQVEKLTLTLTPQQWEVLQELLNQRHRPQPVFPLTNGTITFDEFPNLGGRFPTELS